MKNNSFTHSLLFAGSLAATTASGVAIAKNQTHNAAKQTLSAQSIGKVTYVSSIDEIPYKLGKGTQVFAEVGVPTHPKTLQDIEKLISGKYPEYNVVIYLRGKTKDPYYGSNMCGIQSVEEQSGYEKEPGSKSPRQLTKHLSGSTNLSSNGLYMSIYISGIGESGERTSERGMCSEFSPEIINALGGGYALSRLIDRDIHSENGSLFHKGKILEIVNNTVGYIDSKYKAALQLEQEAKELKERQKQGVIQSSKQLEKGILQLEEKYPQLNIKTHPQYNLVQPQLRTAEKFLAEGKVSMAVKSTNRAVDYYTEIYNDVKRHQGFGENFNSLHEALIKNTEGHPFVISIPEYQELILNLDEAKTAHSQGDFGYLEKYEEAKEILEEIEHKIMMSDVEKGAIMATAGISGIASLSGLFIAWRRRKISKEEFNEMYESLEKKLDSIKKQFDKKKRESRYLISYLESGSTEGETQQRLEQYKKSFTNIAENLQTFSATIKSIKGKAYEGFGTKKLINGKDLLESNKVTINDDEQTHTLSLEDSLVKIEALYHKNITSFEGDLQEASESKEHILSQILSYKKEMTKVSQTLNNTTDGIVKLELTDLFSKLQDKIAKIIENKKYDILGLNTSIGDISMNLYQMIEHLKEISGNTDNINLNLKDLFDIQQITQSIQEKYNTFSQGDISDENTQVLQEVITDMETLNTLFHIIGDVNTLDINKGQLAQQAKTLKEKNPNKPSLFHEEGYDIDTIQSEYESIRKQLAEHVSNVNTQGAGENQESAIETVNNLETAINKSKDSLQHYDGVDISVFANREDIVNYTAKTKELLSGKLRSKWKLSETSLKQIGINDGDLKNNITIPESNNTKVKEILSEADTLFHTAGKVIEAMSLLKQAQELNSESRTNLDQILSYEDFLEKLDEENEELLKETQNRVSVVQQKINIQDDIFLSKDTKESVKISQELLQDLKKYHAKKVNDPYALNGEYKDILKRLEQINTKIEEERNAFTLYQNNLEIASNITNNLRTKSQQMQADRLPEGNKVDKVFRNTQNSYYRNSFNSLYNTLIQAKSSGNAYNHTVNWREEDRKVRSLIREINHDLSVLKDDESLRKEAYNAIDKASDEVKDTSRWTGSYVNISSYRYGKSDLRKANNAYSSGDFSDAIRYAQSAEDKAQSALREAKSDEDDEERKRRRARQRSSYSYSSGSSSTFSSSSSSTSFGGGSGFGGGGFGGGF